MAVLVEEFPINNYALDMVNVRNYKYIFAKI
jgi:hypothetical protein